MFTRAECGLCSQAKGVLSQVWDKKPFQFKEIDLSKPEFKAWKDIYDFDIPVIHISRDDLPEESVKTASKALRLMHRFEQQQVETKMDQAEKIKSEDQQD